MHQTVQTLWEKISSLTPDLTYMRLLDNYRATVANSSTPEGSSTFSRIKALIGKEVPEYRSVDDLVALFNEGPWNNSSIKGAWDKLAKMNEYTNTVNYLWAIAIERLGQMGQTGVEALRQIRAKQQGFKGDNYAPNGGSSMPRIYLKDICGKVLQEHK